MCDSSSDDEVFFGPVTSRELEIIKKRNLIDHEKTLLWKSNSVTDEDVNLDETLDDPMSKQESSSSMIEKSIQDKCSESMNKNSEFTNKTDIEDIGENESLIVNSSKHNQNMTSHLICSDKDVFISTPMKLGEDVKRISSIDNSSHAEKGTSFVSEGKSEIMVHLNDSSSFVAFDDVQDKGISGDFVNKSNCLNDNLSLFDVSDVCSTSSISEDSLTNCYSPSENSIKEKLVILNDIPLDMVEEYKSKLSCLSELCSHELMTVPQKEKSQTQEAVIQSYNKQKIKNNEEDSKSVKTNITNIENALNLVEDGNDVTDYVENDMHFAIDNFAGKEVLETVENIAKIIHEETTENNSENKNTRDVEDKINETVSNIANENIINIVIDDVMVNAAENVAENTVENVPEDAAENANNVSDTTIEDVAENIIEDVARNSILLDVAEKTAGIIVKNVANVKKNAMEDVAEKTPQIIVENAINNVEEHVTISENISEDFLVCNDDFNISEVEENANEIQENAYEVKENASEVEENACKVEENAYDVKENASEVEADVSEVEENASEVEENTSEVEENTSEVEENTSEVEENASEDKKNASEEQEITSKVVANASNVTDCVDDKINKEHISNFINENLTDTATEAEENSVKDDAKIVIEVVAENTAKVVEDVTGHVEDVIEHVEVTEHIEENVAENVPEHVEENVPEHVEENVPEHVEENVPEHVEENVPEHVEENITEEVLENTSEDFLIVNDDATDKVSDINEETIERLSFNLELRSKENSKHIIKDVSLADFEDSPMLTIESDKKEQGIENNKTSENVEETNIDSSIFNEQNHESQNCKQDVPSEMPISVDIFLDVAVGQRYIGLAHNSTSSFSSELLEALNISTQQNDMFDATNVKISVTVNEREVMNVDNFETNVNIQDSCITDAVNGSMPDQTSDENLKQLCSFEETENNGERSNDLNLSNDIFSVETSALIDDMNPSTALPLELDCPQKDHYLSLINNDLEHIVNIANENNKPALPLNSDDNKSLEQLSKFLSGDCDAVSIENIPSQSDYSIQSDLKSDKYEVHESKTEKPKKLQELNISKSNIDLANGIETDLLSSQELNGKTLTTVSSNPANTCHANNTISEKQTTTTFVNELFGNESKQQCSNVSTRCSTSKKRFVKKIDPQFEVEELFSLKDSEGVMIEDVKRKLFEDEATNEASNSILSDSFLNNHDLEAILSPKKSPLRSNTTKTKSSQKKSNPVRCSPKLTPRKQPISNLSPKVTPKTVKVTPHVSRLALKPPMLISKSAEPLRVQSKLPIVAKDSKIPKMGSNSVSKICVKNQVSASQSIPKSTSKQLFSLPTRVNDNQNKFNFMKPASVSKLPKKVKTPNKYMNVQSPVGKYIQQVTVSPLIQTVKPQSKIGRLQTTSKSNLEKTENVFVDHFLSPAKYCNKSTEKNPIVPKPVLKVHNSPFVTKHIGPKRIIPGSEYLRNEESVLETSQSHDISSDMNMTIVQPVNVIQSHTIENIKP